MSFVQRLELPPGGRVPMTDSKVRIRTGELRKLLQASYDSPMDFWLTFKVLSHGKGYPQPPVGLTTRSFKRPTNKGFWTIYWNPMDPEQKALLQSYFSDLLSITRYSK